MSHGCKSKTMRR